MMRPKRRVLQFFLLQEDLKDSVHGGLYDEDLEDSVHGYLYDADQENSVHGLYEVFMMRNRRILFLDRRCPCRGTRRLCPQRCS